MSTPSNHEESLFEQALGIESSLARDAYLREACGADVTMLERLQGLIGAHHRAGRFLESSKLEGESPLPPTVDAPSTEKSGDRIGRYKLLEQIGEGGMGTVWMAEQEEPVHRRVALKIIKLGMDTRQVLARFEAERQALALMDHPNIARVFDGGATSAGRPYFVMELVRGLPITRYCEEARLSTRQRIELFGQVCLAVQHAHQKGIIHRDLKPSNILVTVQDERPVVKVIDFGVAKATEGRLTEKTLFTGFDQLIGTPAYMSPEQAGLGGLDIDTRSDTYSLGVVLYELLTGRPPFDTKVLLKQGYEAMLRTIREVDPVKPSTRLTDLIAAGVRRLDAASARSSRLEPQPDPDQDSSRRLLQEQKELVSALRGDLDWIVMKCLEKDRRRRYDTANSLAMDLERYLHDEPVLARPPSAVYRWKKFAQRNNQMVAAASLVALALVLGMVVSAWQWHRAVHARQGEEEHRKQAEAMAKAEAAASEEANRQRIAAQENLYAADMSLAQRALEEGNLARARSLLELHRPEATGRDFRGFEWRYLLRASASQSEFQLDGHGSEIWSVSFSPDGKTVATASWDRTVKLWDVASQRLLATLTNFDGIVNCAAFSPDGRTLATASGDHLVKFWDLGDYTVGSAYNVTSAFCVAFSPVNSILAVAAGGTWIGNNGDVKLMNLATGHEVRTLPKVGNRLAISRDGSRLATGGEGGKLSVWDINTGEPVRTFDIRTADKNDTILAVAFSADGELLAVSDFPGRVQVWAVATGELIATPIGHTGRAFGLAFSPTENLLAQAGSDATVRLWAVHPRERSARPVAIFRGHTREVSCLAFSPDGRLLASGGRDGTGMLWNLRPGPEDNVLTNAFMGHSTCRPVISPDGKFLTAMTGETAVGVWNLATGRLLSVFEEESFALTVSSEAEYAVTLGTNLSLRTWNVATGRRHSTVTLSDLADVSPDRSDRKGVFSATLSPDGRTLVTGQQNGNIIHWNALTGARLATLNHHKRAVRMMTFSSDGRRLLTASVDETSKLLDLATHQELLSMEHSLLVFAAAFSPDERTVITGSVDATLWDAASGGKIATLQAHKEGVFWLAFSPSGKTLATASDDRTVKLWNLATRREVATLRHEKPVLYAGFTPDGNTLVTGTVGGPVLLWRGADVSGEIALAE